MLILRPGFGCVVVADSHSFSINVMLFLLLVFISPLQNFSCMFRSSRALVMSFFIILRAGFNSKFYNSLRLLFLK